MVYAIELTKQGLDSLSYFYLFNLVTKKQLK